MIRSLTRVLAIALTTLMGVQALPAGAESSSTVLERIAAGKLRVGMSGNQPPLNFESKDGQMMGLEVDMARALAALMGVELEIVKTPFGDLLGSLAKGDIDLVMSGMTITAERNMRAAFVGPYYLSGKSILTKSATLAAADETGDLDKADLTLVALEGSTSQAFVEALLPNAKLITATDYDAAVKLLLDDKAQALVADQEIVALTAFLNPRAQLATLTQPLTIEPYGIAAAAGDSLLLNFLENTFGALEAAGALEALRNRWLTQGDWVDQLP